MLGLVEALVRAVTVDEDEAALVDDDGARVGRAVDVAALVELVAVHVLGRENAGDLAHAVARRGLVLDLGSAIYIQESLF